MQTAQPDLGSNNRNLIIGIVVVIVMCGCGLVSAIGGYYGYRAYQAAQTAVQNLNNPNPDITNAPQGGLSDPAARSTAWLTLQLIAATSGCQNPIAAESAITVMQQPDIKGEWIEEWNIKCGNGSSKPFKVTFTSQENGVVAVTVEIP